MNYYSFEVFIQKDNPKDIDWERFVNAVFEYQWDFDLEIDFSNQISFFLFGEKNLSKLAAKINPFILKPVEIEKFAPESKLKSFFIRLPQNKSLLDVVEKESIRLGMAIKKIIFKFRKRLSVHICNIELYFEDRNGNLNVAKRSFPSIPYHLLQSINWETSVKYKKKNAPIYLKLDEVASLFTHQTTPNLLEVEGFPYFTEKTYFGLNNYEFGKHSLIVGQTGVGKSKFLSLFVKEMERLGLTDSYSVVVIDPHASLYSDMTEIKMSTNIDFIKTECNLFFQDSEPKIGTELTILLFKTLLKDQFNSKVEQVLKYSLFSLLSAKEMGLFNLRKFLTEMDYRKDIFDKFENSENMAKFFDTEYLEMQTKFYDSAVMPILTLLDELNFLPAFAKKDAPSLPNILKDNFLTSFSLSKIFLGDKATTLIAGLLIQQIFLIAQSKTIKKNIILIIDEAPSIQNEALITILSEARKFGLSLFLSMQYLNQMKTDILKGIVSNTYNYFVFKVTEEDAQILKKNLIFNIPSEVLNLWEERKESKDDLKIKLFTSLNIRECIVRPYANGKFYSCFKAITFNV